MTHDVFKRGPPSEILTSHSATQLQQRLLDFTRKSEEHDIILPNDNEGFLLGRKKLADVVAFDVQQGNGSPEEEARRKFLVELGGGAEMRTKMASGSLVFRPLLLGDWVSEHSVPWVHYVPVQVRVNARGELSSSEKSIFPFFVMFAPTAGSLGLTSVNGIF